MRKLLKIFFYFFYHNCAWTYDLIAALVSVGRWNDWRNITLRHIRGPRVLELGYGTGHLQVMLHKRGFLTFGIDESQQMTNISRKRLIKNSLQPALSRGYVQYLPFAANSLESIVTTFPSEFIMDNRALEELLRVLAPSGKLVVVPIAWIEGKSLPDQVAKWLFRVTGQAGEKSKSLEKKLKLNFRQAGFHVELFHEDVRESLVLVVIAQKPSEPSR